MKRKNRRSHRVLKSISLLLLFSLTPIHSFAQVPTKRLQVSNRSDQRAIPYNRFGNCTKAQKLFSQARQISFWGGPERESAIAFTDSNENIQIYDSDDGIFGNGGNEGAWMPYAPYGGDANPQLWGRYLAFTRIENTGSNINKIMIVDLGLTGKNPGIPDEVMTGQAGDYFSSPRIMGWYSEPYLSWIHYPSGGTPSMYACLLSQCASGNHPAIGINTINWPWDGFMAPPTGPNQYPFQIWNEAAFGQSAHVATQLGSYAQHWPSGNGNEYLKGFSLPYVLTRDKSGIHVSDFYSGNRAFTSRPPSGTRDLEGALTKRPILGIIGFWDHVVAWIRTGVQSGKSISEINVNLRNGRHPYHEIKVPAPRENAAYGQVQVDRGQSRTDQAQVVFRDNINGDVFHSICSFNP